MIYLTPELVACVEPKFHAADKLSTLDLPCWVPYNMFIDAYYSDTEKANRMKQLVAAGAQMKGHEGRTFVWDPFLSVRYNSLSMPEPPFEHLGITYASGEACYQSLKHRESQVSKALLRPDMTAADAYRATGQAASGQWDKEQEQRLVTSIFESKLRGTSSRPSGDRTEYTKRMLATHSHVLFTIVPELELDSFSDEYDGYGEKSVCLAMMLMKEMKHKQDISAAVPNAKARVSCTF